MKNDFLLMFFLLHIICYLATYLSLFDHGRHFLKIPRIVLFILLQTIFFLTLYFKQMDISFLGYVLIRHYI